jgi:hypothetical protein
VKDILKKIIKNKKKKALSEMVAYVILISIALSIAVGVYAWMKLVSNPNIPADCNEGTSISLDSVSYNAPDVYFIIKNNGLFNVSGVLISIGPDPKKTPTYYLMPLGGLSEDQRGYFEFDIDTPLKSGETNPNVKFTMDAQYSPADRYIRVVQVQPYIIVNKKRVMCKNVIFKDDTLNVAIT